VSTAVTSGIAGESRPWAMIQQQHQGRQQESACLLAAVAVDDRAGAIIHDVSVIRQRS